MRVSKHFNQYYNIIVTKIQAFSTGPACGEAFLTEQYNLWI